MPFLLSFCISHDCWQRQFLRQKLWIKFPWLNRPLIIIFLKRYQDIIVHPSQSCSSIHSHSAWCSLCKLLYILPKNDSAVLSNASSLHITMVGTCLLLLGMRTALKRQSKSGRIWGRVSYGIVQNKTPIDNS